MNPGEMNERGVVGGLALVANEQSSKGVVPAVGSFDDPAAGLAVNAAHEGRFERRAVVTHGPKD
jgi:hypothetical protein